MLMCRSVSEVKPFGKNILAVHPDQKYSENCQNEKRLILLNGDDLEEVCWHGRTVIVSSFDEFENSYMLKKCFTVETDVKDVSFTKFFLDEKSTGLVSCICILGKDCISVYTDVGELFIAWLPFKVKNMWALENGLCVEREAAHNDGDDEKGMPTLFSLTHPLEDFKPVVYHYKENHKAMYFSDPSQYIVFTCPEKCLVMTYDSILGLHSVWKIRKALEQDFPDINSHQDSLPEFLGFMNHSSNVLNPKDRSRLSMSPSACGKDKRHSCPPVPIHLQRRSSPAKLASPKAFSPVVHAQDASYIDLNTSRRTHMSSSPMMFRMSSADTKLEEELEPLPPNICLEQIWQEQGNLIRYGMKGKAERAFLTEDFSGNEYIGYHLKALGKLRLMKSLHMKSNLSFEKAMELDCLDAGPLKNCQIYVVLDCSQTINLYSGKQKVMKVQMPDEFSENDMCLDRYSLMHFSRNSFTVGCTSKDGKMMRLSIPEWYTSSVVLSCISSLRKVLSDHDYNLVHSKYFAMFHDSQSGEHGMSDWEKFIKASLKLLGFPESSLKSLKEDVYSPAPPEAKKAKKSDSLSGIEDWEYLLASTENNFIDEDSRKCHKKFLVEISFQKKAPLYQHFTAVFKAWNQLYEELKLNALDAMKLADLAKFLHYLSKVSCSDQSVIYETDYPEIRVNQDTVYRVKEEQKVNPAFLQSGAKENLQSLITQMMNGISRKICHNEFTGPFSTVVAKVFNSILKQKDVKSTGKWNGWNKKFLDAILDILLKENFTVDDLERLPICFKLPIKEILHSDKDSNATSMTLKRARFLGREDIIALKESQVLETQENSSNHFDMKNAADSDGLTFNDEIFRFRFNQDLRVNEVKRLLNSSIPVNVTVEQKPDVNDHAFAKEEEAQLLLLSKRTMSLPISRGMFTLGTSHPDASKPVSIPVLDLSGRSTKNNKIIQISQAEINTARLLWPSFHNGVAAGLKIAPGSLQIDSTWILFNKLKCSDLNASHSGFLFALGLMGHISSLPKLHLHDYLIKGHDLTTAALLIGMAVTQIGTKNASTYKVICLHLDSLLPPTALELNIPCTSQIASIISLGFLFFETFDMHIIKVLLQEIGRPAGPEMENSTDRESHALAAGLALGMIMIGKGTDITTVPDVNVFDLLYHYVKGGQKKDKFNSEKKPSSSCQIHEGDAVNTDVTAPAAIMTLGLMYLKTNNRVVANMLNITSIENVTDIIKPDHCILSMLAYNIIMWENLIPTEAWLASFIPEFKQILNMVDAVDELFNSIYNKDNPDLHYRLCIIAGCMLALAIKFAGSCNYSAFNIMFPWIKVIRRVSESLLIEGMGCKIVVEQCLNTVVIALSILMAGSGNLQVFRVARQLYKRCSHDVSYGNHMCSNMAIGFLFLGGGRYTLKTDNIAIASLLCAVYPKWPVSSKDNRFHLQALRHLYVLASEARLFITRDVDTKAICYTPISVTIKETNDYDGMEYKMLSPCFLPESKFISKVVTRGPRYWPFTVDVLKNNKSWLKQLQNVFVKKKAGYLSYTEDPRGFRNLLGRTFANQSDKLESVKAFSSSRQVLLFEELFCKSNEDFPPYIRNKPDPDFFSSILCKCVRQEKLDVLHDYMAIEKIISDVMNDSISINGIQQMSFLFQYYSQVHPVLEEQNCAAEEPLIDYLYLMQCRLRLETHIKNIEDRGFEANRSLNLLEMKKIIHSI